MFFGILMVHDSRLSNWGRIYFLAAWSTIRVAIALWTCGNDLNSRCWYICAIDEKFWKFLFIIFLKNAVVFHTRYKANFCFKIWSLQIKPNHENRCTSEPSDNPSRSFHTINFKKSARSMEMMAFDLLHIIQTLQYLSPSETRFLNAILASQYLQKQGKLVHKIFKHPNFLKSNKLFKANFKSWNCA